MGFVAGDGDGAGKGLWEAAVAKARVVAVVTSGGVI